MTGPRIRFPIVGRDTVKILNFYSSVYQANLVVRRKSCTIRLGDKTDKYLEGDVVWVTYGNRFRAREFLFSAVIDRVTVKELSDLTPEDIRAENDEFQSVDEVLTLLSQIYDRDVGPEEQASVIYFSEIRGGTSRLG